MMYHMWARHHLRPGDFWNLPRGERMMLIAFSQEEMDSMTQSQ